MFEFKACEVFEIKELTFVNDCFKHKHNEEIGHYRQTLNRYVKLIIEIPGMSLVNETELKPRLKYFYQKIEKKLPLP